MVRHETQELVFDKPGEYLVPDTEASNAALDMAGGAVVQQPEEAAAALSAPSAAPTGPAATPASTTTTTTAAAAHEEDGSVSKEPALAAADAADMFGS